MIPIPANPTPARSVRFGWALSACLFALACLPACNLTDRPGLDQDPVFPPEDTTDAGGGGDGGGVPRANHAPSLGLGVHDLSMLEGESKVIVLKARDEDGDPVRFSIPNLDSLRALFADGNRAITVASAGDSLRLAFTPGPASGNFRFRILVSDTAGASEEQILTISVGKVNRPPIVSFTNASGTAFKVKEGATLEFQVGVRDPEGGKAVLLALSNPPWPKCGEGGFEPSTGKVRFAPAFRCVAAGETTFSDLVFRAKDDGSPSETGQIAARITVIDSNSPPRWRSASQSLAGKEGAPMGLDLKPLFAGDDERDAVSFSAACGTVDSASLRWTFTPGFRDAGARECAVTARDSHRPSASSSLNLVLDIADSVRKVDVAILSPLEGALIKDSVVEVEWMIGDAKQKTETRESLPSDGPHVLVRSYRDSLGNYGSDSVTVVRDMEGPLPPVIDIPELINTVLPRWTWKGGGGGVGKFKARLDNPDLRSVQSEREDTLYVPLLPLSEGRHVLYVQERDAAGNWSPVAGAAVTIDVTPPKVKILSPAAGSWTNAASVDVRWTVDGAVQAEQATETLAADGVVQIKRAAFDAAGNRGADSILILRRTAAGAAPLLSGSPSPTRAPEWTWETGGPGGTGTYRLGWAEGEWFATVAKTRYVPPADLPEGPQTLYVSESDSAGNWSAAARLTLVVDRTPPVLGITGPAPEAAITSADPPLSGTLVEANGTVTVRWSGTGLTAGQAEISGPDWTLPALAYPAGDVTVKLVPVDAAGNEGAAAAVAIHKRPGVVFVRKGKAGQGTSWQDAYGEVWQAAAGAAGAKEIWVADGVYPTSGDGAASLDVPSGVAVYGGFSADGTGKAIADRDAAALKTILVCSGTGFAVRMLGNASLLDGFRIEAAGNGLQGDSGNTGRSLLIAGAGGPNPVEIVAGDNGKTFRLEKTRIEDAKGAVKAALAIGAKAKLELADCAVTGALASDPQGGGGIWMDSQAQLKATGLALSGNGVADPAGARPVQMRVEDKAKADLEGEVEGGADGIEVVPGGKAELNGKAVPELKPPEPDPPADPPAEPTPDPAPDPAAGGGPGEGGSEPPAGGMAFEAGL